MFELNDNKKKIQLGIEHILIYMIHKALLWGKFIALNLKVNILK